MIAYGQSKTANVLFAVEADRRWRDDGIRANAVHPGAIIETNLARHYDPVVLQGLIDSGGYRFKTTAQGAATSVFARCPRCSTASAAAISRTATRPRSSTQAGPTCPRPASRATRSTPEFARQLWEVSQQLTMS